MREGSFSRIGLSILSSPSLREAVPVLVLVPVVELVPILELVPVLVPVLVLVSSAGPERNFVYVYEYVYEYG